MLAAFAFWSLVAVVKSKLDVVKYELVGTIVILFFLIHPMLVKNFFNVFSCREIHGQLWLVENLEIECWEGDHLFYAIAVALPS